MKMNLLNEIDILQNNISEACSKIKRKHSDYG